MKDTFGVLDVAGKAFQISWAGSPGHLQDLPDLLNCQAESWASKQLTPDFYFKKALGISSG